MPVLKRKNSPFWYVRFTAPNGTRVFESTQTADRKAAQEFEAQLKARLWREQRLGETQATWPEAVLSWLSSKEHKDRSGVEEKLRWLHPHLGELSLRNITGSTLYAVREAKLAEGVSPATVNRHLAVVSAVLRHALTREWLSSVPPIPRLQEPTGRLRFLSFEEADRLIAQLRSQPRSGHLADMAEFSLATGLREANVTGLRWDWVDLERRVLFVPAEHAKGKRLIRVPLNDAAITVLERCTGQHAEWVFTYRGKRVKKANRDGFQAAVAALGWEDVSWHTLRHTWASWHAMAGTPLQVLMELGGWRTYTMVLRYAHLAPDHLAAFAENRVQNRCTSTEGGIAKTARKSTK